MQNFSKFDVTNMLVERQFIDRQYFSVEDVSEAWDWVHAAMLPTDGGYDDGDGRRPTIWISIDLNLWNVSRFTWTWTGIQIV